jgi:hypothetical protein
MRITLLKQKKAPLLVLFGAMILFSLAIIYLSLQNHPLGEKGEYLGVASFGRAPLTDSPRYDLYYYGTDLAPHELAAYFNASASNPSGDPNEYSLKLTSGEDVALWFYMDKNNPNLSFRDKLKNTSKKHFFYIHDQGYELLKKSLK